MATAFSNHSLLFGSTLPYVTKSRIGCCCRHSSTIAIPKISRPVVESVSRPGRLYSDFSVSRRPFRASFIKAAASNPKVINEDNDHPEDKIEGSYAMKELIQDYKEAVLNGDEKSISKIEVAIYSIEKEKNDLFDKVEEITADISSGKQNILRLNADFENFRKRTDKDRLKFTSDIQGEVIESVLPMVDSFERTKQQIKPQTEKENKIDKSYQGIYKQFVEILRTLHIAAIDSVGKKFDPSVHEAVASVVSEQFREGTVIQEVRRGFILGDRVLRPAMVKVSSGSGVKNPPSTPVAKSDEKSVPATESS